MDELPLPPLHAPDRQILSAAVFTDAAIEKDVNALKHHACDSRDSPAEAVTMIFLSVTVCARV